MRKEADRALSLYILYSALTGSGQLRKQQNNKFANILAIYEKGSTAKGAPRVKFFDMWDIVNKADMFKTGAVLKPEISSINLNNDLVSNSGVLSRKDANTRISKLLVEARNKNISAALSKHFLNSIY
jgi:hypothetical protein